VIDIKLEEKTMATTTNKPTHSAGPSTPDSVGSDIIKIILAVILPPLGVFMEVGLTKHFWINIVLTLLGFIPGIVHAVYIIAKR